MIEEEWKDYRIEYGHPYCDRQIMSLNELYRIFKDRLIKELNIPAPMPPDEYYKWKEKMVVK